MQDESRDQLDFKGLRDGMCELCLLRVGHGDAAASVYHLHLQTLDGFAGTASAAVCFPWIVTVVTSQIYLLK